MAGQSGQSAVLRETLLIPSQWQNIGLFTGLILMIFTLFILSFKGKNKEGGNTNNNSASPADETSTTKAKTKAETTATKRVELRIIYGTTTGTARRFASVLLSEAPTQAMWWDGNNDATASTSADNGATSLTAIAPLDADGADAWELLDANENDERDCTDTSLVVVVLMSTWTGGTVPVTSARWLEALKDMSTDFRVGSAAMSKVRFGVYGLGSSEYDSDFCKPAHDISEYFRAMGAVPLLHVGTGDDSQDISAHFSEWRRGFWKALSTAPLDVSLTEAPSPSASKTGCCGGEAALAAECSCESTTGSAVSEVRRTKPPRKKKIRGKPKKAAIAMEEIERMQEDEINEKLLTEADLLDSDSDDNALDGTSGGSSSSSSATLGIGDDGAYAGGSEMVDLEDLGSSSGLSSGASSESGNLLDALRRDGAPVTGEVEVKPRPEMVTPLQKKALTKEGYKLIGSHSAVKLCRWTKHQLRGRGGCYKHTCYGITSYQCMEATPSLACANKCVFCWRHHKNPVGREWRWKEDPPEEIVAEAIRLHVRMVNEFKGAKGVKPERIAEAFTVKHCALSLVGEPIMYPHINELVQELHKREISTFLVTNAQFPDQIAKLVPCTQLYVSIDAATKESLRAVDRPLFKDFWERFLACLSQLRDKRQRTVYRLTLVKSWNMEEVEAYVKLLDLGEPDLIEIKAVTYCGTSDASSLTMENVPWHHEVLAFAQAIADHAGVRGRYGVACEHKHSCLVLLARKDIYLKGDEWWTWIDYDKFHELSRRHTETGEQFTSADYLAKTPYWAVHGAAEEGFDPAETRVRRYKSTESGCG